MKMELRAAFEGLIDSFRPAAQQVAALCLRTTDRGLEVLLVTSSKGNWILPKGWPEQGLTGAESALAEAWEEAGVIGSLATAEKIGTFDNVKLKKSGRVIPTRTSVYQISVRSMATDFPEAGLRKVEWVPLAEAVNKVGPAGLSKFLAELAKAPPAPITATGTQPLNA